MFLTTAQVAAHSGVSIDTVSRWARRGLLPPVGRRSHQWLFRRSDVERWMQTRLHGNPGARVAVNPDVWGPPPPDLPDAACAEACARGHAEPDDWYDGDVLRALRICDGCPVRFDCLEYALHHDIADGIWGGIGPHGRKKMLVAR